MHVSHSLGVVARYAGTVCAIPALLLPTLAIPHAARAQGFSLPTLSCVTDVTGPNSAGKIWVTLPGSVVGTQIDGKLIIAVDPSCLNRSIASSPPDKYVDAKAAVDSVIKRAKEAGVPHQVADRAGTELNRHVDDARKTGDEPSNQVAGGNDARAKQSAERPDNGDDAMVAAIAGVAGVCMVASAGICAAAAAAVLPSILPAKVSSEDVRGIASVLNDINQGKPVSPERFKALVDAARKHSKASEADLAVLGKLAETRLKIVAENILVDKGVQPDTARRLIELINKSMLDGRFSCDEVFRAANILGPIRVADKTFTARIVATVDNSRYAASIAPDVRACLNKYFDAGQ